MLMVISNLFVTYLIYPILGLIIIILGIFIAKKNGLTKNKRFITYTLSSVLILTAPAILGLLNHSFMPYAYIALVGIYIITGVINNELLTWALNKELKFGTNIIYIIFQTLVSMLLFMMVFNLCNEFKYGIWASTAMLPFVLPSLLIQSYHLFIYIPTPIYKIWSYNQISDLSMVEEIDHKKLKVVKVELFKRDEDTEPTRINTKFPEEMVLGNWIKLLFDDYNKHWAHSQIEVLGENTSGWIFYVKSWFLAPRRYLDHELTLKENRIKESHLIVAKRVENIIKE